MWNKYKNIKTSYNGRTYDSKKEAVRAAELAMLQRTGVISDLQEQVRFEVVPKTDGERAVTYVADFVYTESGKRIIEDVKSPITRKDKAYIIKRKLMKWRYADYVFRES